MSDHSITSLIEKLEGAEAGSNALSDQVLSACGYIEIRFPMDSCPYWVHASAPKTVLSVNQESVTSSLDAALALAGRIWPHVMWRVGHDPDDGSFKAQIVTARKPGDPPAVHTNAATAPLALCAAILRAQSEARV